MEDRTACLVRRRGREQCDKCCRCQVRSVAHFVARIYGAFVQGECVRDLPQVPAQMGVERSEGGVYYQVQRTYEGLWLLCLSCTSARELSRQPRESGQVSLSTVSRRHPLRRAFLGLICAAYAERRGRNLTCVSWMISSDAKSSDCSSTTSSKFSRLLTAACCRSSKFG